MQLEIIRRHHEEIVREERHRSRSEQELRRLVPLFRAQLEQWRGAGGAEADCPLASLLAEYELALSSSRAESRGKFEGRWLRGEEVEGPVLSVSPAESRGEAEGLNPTGGNPEGEKDAAAPAVVPPADRGQEPSGAAETVAESGGPELPEEPVRGRPRSRRRSQE